MKKIKTVYTVLILCVAIFSSCVETFETVDTKSFNEKIAGRTDIKTPEELMKLYYDYDCSQDEGNPTITTRVRTIGKNKYKITLIHEGFADDSQAGGKIVMTAQQTGATWIVTKIKTNWKCWEDRGHTYWGTGRCS
ncbi:MAG: hypothetical protein FWC39_02175 [Bacteroidetes bacterium]|nr:hypothetical protein [Bacteroidota bacterium]